MNNTHALIGAVVAVVALWFLLSKKTPTVETYSNVDNSFIDMSSGAGQVYTRFNQDTYSIILNNNLDIDEYMPLAVIMKESYFDFKTKKNNQVIGDDGKSIGYMQVSKPAVIDVNKYYNTTFTVNDLSNEYNNLLVGCLYLNICYLTALKKSSNPVWLAFKKYNGGNDETDNSVNNMATNYANNALNYYNNLKVLI